MNKYQKSLNYIKNAFVPDMEMLSDVELAKPFYKKTKKALNILQELVDRKDEKTSETHLLSLLDIKDKHISLLRNKLRALDCDEPLINPCDGCTDYCYKADTCKSNGGCGNKSARERFKEAGFDYEDCVEGKIIYFNENTEIQIEFNLEEKTYEIFELFNRSVDIELHKLIHCQLEELGWL